FDKHSISKVKAQLCQFCNANKIAADAGIGFSQTLEICNPGDLGVQSGTTDNNGAIAAEIIVSQGFKRLRADIGNRPTKEHMRIGITIKLQWLCGAVDIMTDISDIG